MKDKAQPAQADMTPEYAAAVRELAEQSDMSEAQVLRAAIRLYQAEQKGLVTVEHKEQIGPLAAPQPAQAKSRQQEIINSIKSALIRHEAATDAVIATAAGDDPHAATLAGIELEKAAALLATWTQPEYLRVMLDAAPAAPQPEAQPQWQPIETAPKDSTNVLIYTPNSRKQVQEAWWAIQYEGSIDGYWSTPIGPAGRGYTILPKAATHWMPLPVAPSAQAEPAKKPDYRAECWPESPHNKAEQKGTT